MTFFAELKQRKVFRVGAAYVVAGWLAVQVASIALPAFDAPPWAMRAFILAVALGFPLALLLSWALELTPEGLKLTPGKVGTARLTAICGVLVALSLGWYFYAQPVLQQHIAEGERSIAVLPFQNLGGDASTSYFSDGLAETSLDMLARVPSLKVIARSSSFTFRDAALDVADVGRRLDVAHLLQGSVQQAGQRVRVTVQLVRTSDGAQLWSQRFDRDLKDVFAIQDEIAREVVQAIRIALPEGGAEALTPGGTRNVAAYEEFLRGNQKLWTRQIPDMQAAKAHFERALSLDDDYMQAKAMALMAEQMIASNSGAMTRDLAQRLKSDYDTVLEEEPRQAEAYVGRANVLGLIGDVEDSLEDYRKGIELRPSFAVAHQWMAERLFFDLERVDEAVVAYRRAMELDPITPQIRLAFARTLVAQDRTNEALALLNEVHKANPGNDNTALELSRLQLESGDILGAFRTLHQTGLRGGNADRLRIDACIYLMMLSDPAGSRCAARLKGQPEQAMMLQVIALYAMVIDGRADLAAEKAEKMAIPVDAQELILLVAADKNPEALARIQRDQPGLLENPPRLRALDVTAYPTAALLLYRTGEAKQAQTLLQAGLKRFSSAPTFGETGRGWTEAVAHAMLGDVEQACMAMRRQSGMNFNAFLTDLTLNERTLAFRETECFQSELKTIRGRIDAQILQARQAGYLPSEIWDQ